uniref:Uncharacterized protein n=1 Tax=Rhizophagus irregularis (strain DAOM 181602 / DAOM 197198 / MUCL 43194) TaxID=747089 RepID=U9TGZ1_RHIID
MWMSIFFQLEHAYGYVSSGNFNYQQLNLKVSLHHLRFLVDIPLSPMSVLNIEGIFSGIRVIQSDRVDFPSY